jgi:prolyl-tRNA synthetase
MLVRRDRDKGEEGQKTPVALADLETALRAMLEEIQVSLLEQAKAFLASHTFAVTDKAEFYAKCKARDGMIDIAWCARPECEAHVKGETGATTRNTYPLNPIDTTCVACGEPAKVRAYFAQSY